MSTIIAKNWPQFLRGTGITLLISIIGTVVGTFIGLMIGVYRTAPKAANKFVALIQKLFGWVLNVYIEVFRGTPMIVQSMVIYYGTAQAFGINIDRTLAAVFIVSINTGAYMSEIVRGGIEAVPKGQMEASRSLGISYGKTMKKVILPQAVRLMLPNFINQFVISLKDTTIVSAIGLVELFQTGKIIIARNYQSFRMYAILAIIYLVMITLLTRLAKRLEKRLK